MLVSPVTTTPPEQSHTYAGHLFDGMPPAAGGGCMDALPEEVLLCILGFLDAHEAVRTCVLAKRWRHLWRYATDLRVVVDNGEFLGSVEKAWEFLNHLLPLREGSPLRACELRFGALGFYGTDGLFDDDGTRRVNTWFWHAMTHRVQDLRLSTFTYGDYWFRLDDMPLKSQHLTRLEFDGVEVYSSFLNFSCCPALEYLHFNDCKLAYNISSKSLKHLTITWCTFWFDSRIHISTPNLVFSLRLSDYFGHTPVLGSMPSLVEAFVSVIEDPVYSCEWHEVSSHCEFCDNSYDIGDGTTGSNSGMLLRGLSEARNLTLKSRHNLFIFKWDLKWCPTFSMLKILLLNDYWCVPNDFRARAHLLQCSPVLEKLTLELSPNKTPQSKMSIDGDFRLMEGSAVISEHLKLVEVKCKVVDQRILKLVFFMCAFNIRLSLE